LQPLKKLKPAQIFSERPDIHTPLILMKLLGHADLKTTLPYVHLSKAHLAEAQKRTEEFRAAAKSGEAERKASIANRTAQESTRWQN
jgi:hypothetical protein